MIYHWKESHQLKRHVQASHWHRSKATHFNSYFGEDNASYTCQNAQILKNKKRYWKWIRKRFLWVYVHTEKYFRNHIKSNRNQIVFTIFQLIRNKMDTVRLVPSQSENGKYNLISVWLNKISKRFLLYRDYFQ